MAPTMYRKTALIEAHQWFKNGDHPGDDVWGQVPDGRGDYYIRMEGKVVRYFRHPPVDPTTGEVSAADDAILLGELRHCDTPERFCRAACERVMHDHGWIDTLEGGHTVCPGDWIATGAQGEHWPIKPDVFAATYEAVSE
jgi:hypothetical protein